MFSILKNYNSQRIRYTSKCFCHFALKNEWVVKIVANKFFCQLIYQLTISALGALVGK